MYRTAEASCQTEWSYEKLGAIRRHMRIPPCTADEDLNRRLHHLLFTGPISLLSGPSASLAARGTRSIGAKRRPISTTHMRIDTRRTRIVSATSCLERASSPSGCDPREASRLDAPRQTKRDPSGGYIPKSPPSPPCPGPDGPLWHRRPSFPSLAL